MIVEDLHLSGKIQHHITDPAAILCAPAVDKGLGIDAVHGLQRADLQRLIFGVLFQAHHSGHGGGLVQAIGGGAADRETTGIPGSVFLKNQSAVTVDDLGTRVFVPQIGLGGLSAAGGCGEDDGLSILNDEGGVEQESVDEPDKNGNCNVRMGAVKMRVNQKDLKLVTDADKAQKAQQKQQSQFRAQVTKSFKLECDVRGMTGEEAWFVVDRYIDDAVVAGVHSATIIHGKGTGALRNALWQRFKADSRVKSFRAGAYGEGDYGVTVLEV